MHPKIQHTRRNTTHIAAQVVTKERRTQKIKRQNSSKESKKGARLLKKLDEAEASIGCVVPYGGSLALLGVATPKENAAGQRSELIWWSRMPQK
jgi:hypothetical protein